MENGGSKARVHFGQAFKQGNKILSAPRAAGGDHRHIHSVGHSFQHFQIEAALDTIGVDGVEHHFSRAVINAPFDPGNCLHAGVLPSALGKDPKRAFHPLDIGGQHHALISVQPSRVVHQLGVADGPGVDADLIRPAFEHPVKIIQGVDAAAHGQRDEDGGSHLGENVREQLPPLGRGSDVVEYQLVRTVVTVEFAQLHRGRHVLQPLKIGALHHPAAPHVQTGNNSFCDHFAASTASFKSTAPM